MAWNYEEKSVKDLRVDLEQSVGGYIGKSTQGFLMVERTSDKFVLIEGVVVNYGDKFCNIICSIMDEWYITSCVFTLKKKW